MHNQRCCCIQALLILKSPAACPRLLQNMLVGSGSVANTRRDASRSRRNFFARKRSMDTEIAPPSFYPMLSRRSSVAPPETGHGSLLRLNIGGTSYKIRYRSIRKFAFDTLLGKFIKKSAEEQTELADCYLEESDEYFFERSPKYFDPIFDYLSSGQLHIPPDICLKKYMDELRFWRIPKTRIDDCCSPFKQEDETIGVATPEDDIFEELCLGSLRRSIWSITEGIRPSRWWKAYEFTSTTFVFISIACLVLSSIPEFQVPVINGDNTTRIGPTGMTRSALNITQNAFDNVIRLQLDPRSLPEPDELQDEETRAIIDILQEMHVDNAESVAEEVKQKRSADPDEQAEFIKPAEPLDHGVRRDDISTEMSNYLGSKMTTKADLDQLTRLLTEPALENIELLATSQTNSKRSHVPTEITSLPNVQKVQAPVPSKKPTQIKRNYLKCQISLNTETEAKTAEKPEMEDHPVFRYLEYVCVTYFTFEYLLRFLTSPKKVRFCVELLNIFDLLAILPFFVEVSFTVLGLDSGKMRKVRWAFLTVRVLRVLRVLRIAKLGRFSAGLQNFARTIHRSQKQLQMVMVILLTGVIFFSTMVYFLEKDVPETHFPSIPAAFWWCIVTMTTVGYGDAVPVTVLGKLVSSGAIVCGVMVLALPITIIVNNFITDPATGIGMSNPYSSARNHSTSTVNAPPGHSHTRIRQGLEVSNLPQKLTTML